jgi:hypothetical protein
MKITKEIREYLRELRKRVTPGLWGRFGYWKKNVPPQPTKGALEAAAGLSIGSTRHTEPVARFSGYGMDVEANADYVTVLVNHIEDLLNDLDELEEENWLLKETLKKNGSKN